MPFANLGGAPAPEPRPKVEPLSATRYRIELTVSAETKATLERIKDLMRHRNPTGDLETFLDTSLGLLLAKLEKGAAREDVSSQEGRDHGDEDGAGTVPCGARRAREP